jgi:hypothetical protein
LNVDDSGGINAQFGRTWHFDNINLGSTLDLSGNDLTGVQSLGADTADVTNQLSAGSVDADDLDIKRLTRVEFNNGPTDVSASRSINSTYQNQTGTAFWVVCRLEATADSTNVTADIAVNKFSAGASDPENVLGSFPESSEGFPDLNNGDRTATTVAIVPDGYYYQVRGFGDSADYQIESIYEREWKNP